MPPYNSIRCLPRLVLVPGASAMSEYGAVKRGKLRLKGAAGLEQRKKKAKKRKREERPHEEADLRHGRWRKVQCLEDIGEKVILETVTGGYVVSLDSGLFSMSPENRGEGDAPEPAEIFTVVRVSETKVAMKSAYGRYIGVNTAGELVGRAEAMGPRETWEPVFEEGKLALSACNHRFLTVTDDNKIMAISEKAREREILSMWCETSGRKKAKTASELEEEKDVAGFELSYVKKFQSFGDHRLRVCEEGRDSLELAKHEGKLHEALLDRREKMKADRYCK